MLSYQQVQLLQVVFSCNAALIQAAADTSGGYTVTARHTR
jgi:hypothetical protein